MTGRLPKPLVPLFHRPLAAWALDACQRAGIQRFAVNTHHLAAAWEGFGNGADISFFHEPDLLDTGGGLKNIGPWMRGEPVLVHNGDIFSTMPLERLLASHAASGLPVTIAVRSAGTALHIALDASGERVTDIRKLLGKTEGTHLFTGIYCVNPEFLDLIPAGQKISVIPAFLQLAAAGKLGAVVIDEGDWRDLGDRDAYLLAHHELTLAPPIHPLAQIAAGAVVEQSVVGPGAIIAAGAIVRDSVIWPGAQVAVGAVLDGCVVFSESAVEGSHQQADL
jgi:mannose-1-phosphate guanylyltransferase